jgi:hydrogenase maturation protease
MDGGTAALDILLLQQGLYKLIVIDAIRAGSKPGTVYRLKVQQKNRLTHIFGKDGQSKISLHQVGLIDALMVAIKMNCAPAEIVVIGVEPGEVGPGLELTEPVRRSVPKVIKEVLKEIKKRISATKTQSHEDKNNIL